MKTLKTIFKQAPVFLHNWKDREDVIGDFEDIYMSGEEYRAEKAPYANVEHWEEKKREMAAAIERYQGVNILFAVYDYIDYSGSAFVLFEQGGKLYEVNGSHCSCMGLEGQWEPEEATLEALEHRLVNGSFGKSEWSGPEGWFADELAAFLGVEVPACKS